MKTITVKVTGKASAKPDLTVITLALESIDPDYEKAMDKASDNLNDIYARLEKAGFEKSEIKTTYFNVSARYDSVREKDGSYARKFSGYVCAHRLKTEFALDMKRLSEALQAIAGCIAKPELNISFTVKDPEAISAELLESACENAKNKAEILCKASGKQLGELVSIDYNWSELNVISPTRYCVADECMSAPLMKNSIKAVDINPEDIDVKDTATFVWEIV